jgi:geranylgeranylglycerol-phosphate geranylgeranyltransferase
MNFRKFRGMLRLFRPDLSVASGVCVLTGQLLALGRLPSGRAMGLGFLSIFMLAGTALVLNDYFDLEVDRVNAPERPLPSGAVRPAEALLLTGIATLLGLGAAWLLNGETLLLALAIWAIGVLYNWRGKQTGLPGNLLVSTCVGLTFVFGAVSVGAGGSLVVWIFSLMAFFLDLGEEIAGDALDREGDQKRGSRSIAILKGKRFALRVSLVLWGIVVLLSLLPMFLRLLGWGYAVCILLMDGLVAFFAVRLYRSQVERVQRNAMRGIYLSATLGLAAFLLGLFL